MTDQKAATYIDGIASDWLNDERALSQSLGQRIIDSLKMASLWPSSDDVAISKAARNLTHIKTTELQCIVEHWYDGKCEQEAADSLAAYNELVAVINQES